MEHDNFELKQKQMEHEAARLKLKRMEFDKYVEEETPHLSKIPRVCKRKVYTDGNKSISSQFEENNPHLGMVSNTVSIITIFGHKDLKQKFH